jgi:hypothetical protein
MCGAERQSANAYCKRCGEWLPDIKTRTRNTFGGETPQQNIIASQFMSVLSIVASLFSAIALYATYLGTGDAKWSVYVAAAFCLCIAGWQASSFLVSLKLQRRLKKGRQSPSQTQLETQRSSPALNPANMTDFVTPPSVTENTTRILEPVPSEDRTKERPQ